MKPGIHHDISIEAYHSGPGVSRSALMKIANGTPLDFQWAKEHPTVSTPAMVLGSAIHAAVLEPELFHATYLPKPKFDRRTKKGKEDSAAWEAEHGDHVGLDPADYKTCVDAAQLVRSKKGPATALREGRAEQSLYWEDRDTSELVKSRPDFLDLERGICVDLKTTSRGLDDRAVSQTLADYSADVQAAMINEGVDILTGKRLEALYLLMLRVSKPMDLRLVRIDLDWLCRGERIFKDALRQYHEAKTADSWPGWAERGVTECPMPVWLKKREEEVQ